MSSACPLGTAHFRELLDRGEDNYVFHRALQCAVLRLPPEQCADALAMTACDLPSGSLRRAGLLGDSERERLTELYGQLRQKYPKCAAVERILLTFLEGEALRAALGQCVWTELQCVIGHHLTLLSPCPSAVLGVAVTGDTHLSRVFALRAYEQQTAALQLPDRVKAVKPVKTACSWHAAC